MKYLRLLLLALLVSCGQSLDTTTFSDDGGDEHNTGTNYNKIKDIEDCLNGDREACGRARSEGFKNIPLFIEDLAEATSISIDGISYPFLEANTNRTIFRLSKTKYNYGGGTYHLNIIVDIQIYDDYSVDIVPKYKWHFQTEWTLLSDVITPSTNPTFLDVFNFRPANNLEWKSHDSNSIHIETIGNAEVL